MASLNGRNQSTGSFAIWQCLARVVGRLDRAIERGLREAGLPPLIWHDALLLLATTPTGELSPADLERSLSMRQYQVSRLLDCLVTGKLVVRRRMRGIGRPSLVALTDRGRQLLQRMESVYSSIVQSEIIDGLSADDAADLFELVSRLQEPEDDHGCASGEWPA
jgi:DNA-binding MarR family transcriptional regulator